MKWLGWIKLLYFNTNNKYQQTKMSFNDKKIYLNFALFEYFNGLGQGILF